MSLHRPNNWFEKEVSLSLQKATPSCLNATRLISEAMDRPLPWRKRLALYFHLMVCVGCERYDKQLRFTHDRLHDLEVHCEEVSAEKLPAEAKQHLKYYLQEARVLAEDPRF